MKKRLAAAGLGLLCLVLGNGLQAQDELEELLLFEEEELIELATKTATRVEEAPGTVQVITGEELRNLGALTLEEALRYLAATEFDQGTFSPTVSFRGVPSPFNNKILLLVDGRIVNSIFRGNFFVNFSQPIDNVRQIEIIRGPGSALYGANAFAGIIDIKTKRGADLDGVHASTGFGRDNFSYQNALFGWQRGDTQVDLVARYLDLAGDDPINDPVRNSDNHNWSFQGRFGYKNLEVTAGFFRSHEGMPGTFAFPTPINRIFEKRTFFDVSYKWGKTERRQFTARWYYDTRSNSTTTRQQLVSADPADPIFTTECTLVPFTVFDENGNPLTCADLSGNFVLSSTSTADSEVFSDEDFMVGEFTWSQDVGKRSNFLVGSSAKFDFWRTRFPDPTDLTSAKRDQHERGNYAFYGQWAFRSKPENPKFLLWAGLRGDYNTQYSEFLSPRVNATWLLHERFIMKAGIGRAFRAPTFLELYQEERVGITTISGNETLEPEKVWNGELHLEGLMGENKRVRLSGTLFQFEIENEIAPDNGPTVDIFARCFDVLSCAGIGNIGVMPPASTLFYLAVAGLQDVPLTSSFANAASRDGQGLEVQFRAPIGKHVRVGSNYSWIDVEETNADRTVVSSHFDIANLVLTVTGWDGRFFATVREHWASHRNASIFNRKPARSTNVTIGFNGKRFQASATGFNVFEDEHIPTGDARGFIERGRNYRVLGTFRIPLTK